MPRFQHVVEDKIICINDSIFPLDWWTTQEPDYSGLADDDEGRKAIGRMYIPGKQHFITRLKNGTPSQFSAETDKNHLWIEGDGYIAKEQVYVDAYNLHLYPPLTQAQLDEQFNDSVDAELYEFDLKAIRGVREWVSKQPDAPQQLKDNEVAAIAKRAMRK